MEKRPFQPESIFPPVPVETKKPILQVSKPIVSLKPPIANSAKNISTSSFLATWEANNDETQVERYYLDVSRDNFQTYLNGFQNKSLQSKTEMVSGLSPFNVYQYRVRVANSKEISGYSNTVEVYTKMNSPIAVSATSLNSTSFVAHWLDAVGATSYFLDVSTQSDFSTFVTGYENKPINGIFASVSNLQPDRTYYYRVRAYNLNSNTTSSSSNTITVLTALIAPVLSASTNINTTSFRVNWGLVDNAVDYYLDISTSPTFLSFVYHDVSTGDVAFYDVTGLDNNTLYYVRLRAVNVNNNPSTYSNLVSTTTTIIAPTSSPASSVTNTSFTANWSSLAGALSYRFDLSTDNFSTFVSGFNNLTLMVNSVNIVGLSPDTTYQYRVRAVGLSGVSSGNSSTINQTTLLNAPVSITATNITHNSFTANWNPVVNADSYHVDVATDNLFSSILVSYNNVSTLDTFLVVSGINQITNYYYRVRASNENGLSNNSNIINVFTSISPPVAVEETNVTSTSFTANWNSVVGADGYFLDVSSDSFSTFISGFNNKLVISTSDSVTGLSPNTNYQYRVRSRYNSGSHISTNSNTISSLTLLNPPVANVASLVNSNSFTANWSSVVGAVEYRLDVSTQSDFSTFVSGYNNLQVLTNSQSVTGLVGSTNYYYRIRAVNVDLVPSNNSNTILTETLPDAPTLNSATNKNEYSFDLSWNSVGGAIEYRLDVSISNLFTTFVSGYNNRQVLTTSENVTGLQQLTTYYCRVRAVFPLYTSDNSNVVSEITDSYLFQYILEEGTGHIFEDNAPLDNDGFISPTIPDPNFTILNLPLVEDDGYTISDISDNLNSGFLNTDGKILYTKIVSGRSAILTRNSDSQIITETNLTNDTGSDYLYPSYSDDFSKITFVKAVGSNYQLGIMNYDGTNVQLIGSNDSLTKKSPKLSPSQTYIVYTKYSIGDAGSSIWKIDVEGVSDLNVTGASYFDESPNWINDVEILFETLPSSESTYYIKSKNLDTSTLTTIYTSTSNNMTHPSLSKDKSKITFQKWDSVSKSNICTINLNGSGFLQLENTNFNNYYPKFSPDGSEIVFLSNIDNIDDYYIWIINSDGTNPYNFTNNDLDNSVNFPDYGKTVIVEPIFQALFAEGSGNVVNDKGYNDNDISISPITPINYYIYSEYNGSVWIPRKVNASTLVISNLFTPQASTSYRFISYNLINNRLVYQKSVGGTNNICISKVDGSGEYVITTNNKGNNPVWSIDGNYVFYIDYDTVVKVKRYEYDTNTTIDITSGLTAPQEEYYLHASRASANKISFIRYYSLSNIDIVLCNYDGSGLSTIFSSQSFYEASFNPSDSRLAISGKLTTDSFVYLATCNLNGSSIVPLVGTGLDSNFDYRATSWIDSDYILAQLNVTTNNPASSRIERVKVSDGTRETIVPNPGNEVRFGDYPYLTLFY